MNEKDIPLHHQQINIKAIPTPSAKRIGNNNSQIVTSIIPQINNYLLSRNSQGVQEVQDEFDDISSFDICVCQSTQCRKKAHIIVMKLEKALYFVNVFGLKSILEPIKLMMFQKLEQQQRHFNNLRGNAEESRFENGYDTSTLPGPQIRGIIMDGHRLDSIDSTAVRTILELIEDLKQCKIELRLSEFSDEIKEIFRLSSCPDKIYQHCHENTITTLNNLISELIFNPSKPAKQKLF